MFGEFWSCKVIVLRRDVLLLFEGFMIMLSMLVWKVVDMGLRIVFCGNFFFESFCLLSLSLNLLRFKLMVLILEID